MFFYKPFLYLVVYAKKALFYETFIVPNCKKETRTYDLRVMSMIAPVENVKNLAKITSYSEDGLVESFEVENKKFVMGIKWHPKLMIDENTRNLFKNFIAACK